MNGLINSSRIAMSVYEKGPTTIEDAIGICRASTRPPASQSTAPHFPPVWTE